MNTRNRIPILLIDNHPEDARLIHAYMEDAGIKYELQQADTLYEGLSLLSRKQFELVLLELNLPDSSGFKTITTYLKRIARVPVIIITDTSNEVIGNQAIKAGAQDFLVKGQFDQRLFGRSVRYALQRSRILLKLQAQASELEINKKRFQEAQEMARFGTWEMDLVSNALTWSDEVFRIFSFPKGSSVPSYPEYLSYIHPEDRERIENFFESVAKEGSHPALEHRILLNGINLRYLTIQGKVQVDETSGKIFLVGRMQDITERKRSEKLIIEKNISSKTARIQEEVLADLGFQIRTPLSSVVNLLFLMGNTGMSELQESYIKNLKISVEDLSLSVNNLMNFSVMVSDHVKVEEEEFNIREFIKGTKNVLDIKADNTGVKLFIEMDEKLPEKIVSDPRKLTQILYNLTDHAIKRSEAGGSVMIRVASSEPSATKMKLQFRVKDAGKRIPSNEIQELLESEKLLLETNPEALEDQSQKQKLAIAIVSKLTRMMNGDLQIGKDPENGTEFSTEIPVRILPHSRLGDGTRPESPMKILLVEDHFLNQMATRKVLTSWSEHITVDIAENGQIAIDKFREYGYDLILMDIQMPVMNGLDAARKIREISDVPIIALTANSTKQEQDKCLKIGMNDYLSKPFKPQELYSRILNIMSLVTN